MRLLYVYSDLSAHKKVICSVLMLLLVMALDATTGYYLSFSVFYVLPVSMLAWGFGRRVGWLSAFCVAVAWSIIAYTSAGESIDVFIASWNFCIRFAYLALFSALLAELHLRIDDEEQLADVDGLTGLFNKRAYLEKLEMLFSQSKRYGHPMTLAYLDLDNFKNVNDDFGHATGDKVLKHAADFMIQHTRKSDLCARLGGDEFSIVFTETDYDGANAALCKLRTDFNYDMSENGWRVSMSIGAISYRVLPSTSQHMIDVADALMYSVKKRGKNSLCHRSATEDKVDVV